MTPPFLSRREMLAGSIAAATLTATQVSGQATAPQAAPSKPPIPAATVAFKDQKLTQTIPIPKQTGRGVPLERGQRLKLINPRGKQIGDMFAFARYSPDEFIAPSYTMTWNSNIYLKPGMPMVSNYGSPLLVLEEDTSGCNDLIWPSCYGRQSPGKLPVVSNCRDNWQAALRAINFPIPAHPEIVNPHNIFQNSPVVDLNGRFEWREPVAKPGDYAVFRALENVVVVVTACASAGKANAYEPKELLMEVYA